MKTWPISSSSSLFQLIAVPALLLLLTFPVRLCFAQSAPQAVSIAVGSDNLTRVLWDNPDGSAALWTIAADGSVSALYTFGSFAGWTAKNIAVAPDGTTRLL